MFVKGGMVLHVSSQALELSKTMSQSMTNQQNDLCTQRRCIHPV